MHATSSLATNLRKESTELRKRYEKEHYKLQIRFDYVDQDPM
jgi:hypothetical protein